MTSTNDEAIRRRTLSWGCGLATFGLVVDGYDLAVDGRGVPLLAWSAGFGRLGGIGGPVAGSLLVAASLALDSIFHILVAIAMFGALLTLVIRFQASRGAKSAAAADGPQVGAR